MFCGRIRLPVFYRNFVNFSAYDHSLRKQNRQKKKRKKKKGSPNPHFIRGSMIHLLISSIQLKRENLYLLFLQTFIRVNLKLIRVLKFMHRDNPKHFEICRLQVTGYSIPNESFRGNITIPSKNWSQVFFG